MSRFLPVMELWAVAVALLTGLAVLTRMHTGAVRPHLRATTGVVTGQKFFYGDEYISGGYVPTLEYTIETGELVRARVKGKPLSEPLEEGSEVPVVYRLDRPDKCYVGSLADHEQRTDVSVWGTCLGAALACGLFLGLAALSIIMWG